MLTFIANLSNDEVFTPPELANEMLDSVEAAWAHANGGASIWSNSEVTFLDPFTKSGVFLREITRRLTEGLREQLPDLEERVDHILTKQVFGIGITQLTALLARRSVYCSKDATGMHSIATSFDRGWGNIWFERTEHTWAGQKCTYCGAGRSEYGRISELETHAYAFIHTTGIKAQLASMFGVNVKFDVIIGNPPYQLSDGGGSGSSAIPIYHRFIEQAKVLEPTLLTMIIPSKWFSGGKGLDEFRATMLADRRLRTLIDFPDSREAFAGVDVAGGVCYFLWNRDEPGACHVETRLGGTSAVAERVLDEFDVFIRDNRVLRLVKKIQEHRDARFSTIVSARRPFGLNSAEVGSASGDLYLFASAGDSRVNRADVPRGTELVDKWKVLLSKTSSEHAGQTDRSGRKRVLSRIEVMPPGSVATESYLIVGPFETENEAKNVASYLRTRFARFFVSAILMTQNITRGSFHFVPVQDFSRPWSDLDLYAKYSLSEDEIALIEAQIKSMEPVDG
ncbi:Eco57I restriction-modification methylase domain-containing protein [Curtobacterium flaccumfaciens]|uniref:Eco57I restriction-modification methylase domain-containing protein n=1 Tax=Curtobacterium flaccumfaciens TaxID=2035 RepID=UPI0037C0C074